MDLGIVICEAHFGQRGIGLLHGLEGGVEIDIALIGKLHFVDGIKSPVPHGHIAGGGHEVQIALLLRQPMGKQAGGLRLLLSGLVGTQAHARLGHQRLCPRCHGQGDHLQIHRLAAPVLIGDGIIIVEDRRGGAKAGEHLAGHHLRIGVKIGYHDMPLGQRTGKLHPALLENGVVEVIPAVFRVEILRAVLQCVQLHGADGIVHRTKRLRVVRPVIEPPGSVIEPLPCREVVIAYAGGGRKAGKARAVEHKKLRGFGQGEHQQFAIICFTVRKEAGHKFTLFLLREPVIPVQQLVLAQGNGVPNVAGKEIRHLLRGESLPLRL